MDKFWQITWREYSRHVFRRRFLVLLLSVPLLLVFVIAIVFLVMWMGSNPTPIGYIDHSGLLAKDVRQPAIKWPERTIPIQAFSDETSAKADLEAGKLQALYIVPADYLQSGKLELLFEKEPEGIAIQQFYAFLRSKLLADQPTEIANRVINGSQVIYQYTAKSSQASQGGILSLVLPFISGILFIITMSVSSGYLLQSVVDEKENRTMEVLVTSVSPNQLMSGKIVGGMAVGLTQIMIWAAFIAIMLVVGKNYIPAMNGISFSAQQILVLSLVMLPAFVMISGLMAAVGATVSQASEGQQIVGLFTIPIWLPYLFITAIFSNPNSPLAVAMSLFPLTAPMTIAMRIGVTTVPTWQIITSVAILVLSAIGAIWLAGRAFRVGMLRYGQRIRLGEILRHQGV